MNIALYFGSFNPIHIGHLIIANYVLNETSNRQLWLIVSPQNPFKNSHSLLNEYQRLHLANLAIGNHSKIKVSDIEFNLPKPSYTIDTMTYLKEKFPTYSFSITLGADSLQNIKKWKNYLLLIKQFPIIVYKRAGFNIDNELKANLNILDAPLLNISSSLIRKFIKERKSVKYLLPDIVIEEIEKAGYYKK